MAKQTTPSRLIGTEASPGLLTDLYELTMAYSFWKAGVTNKEAVFHLCFRHSPFRGGFTVACGLAQVVDYLQQFHFSPEDLNYLSTVQAGPGGPLFERSFLDFLGSLRLSCDVDAMPEGTIVFPQEPLLRVAGPILQAQLLETALLNLINFPTLVATKAARICLAAQGEPVIEFGLRRAQGSGGLVASRAAYVGGCAGTSNVLAGKQFGIPVMGTHAHSWVMAFPSEPEAFHQYAQAMPNNSIFLVDTYDSLEGVRHAIEAGRWLRQNGHELGGIRLDSGDLAYLSIEARKLLDGAGFTKAVIVGSNDLDEYIITSLKEQGAAINVWGVGTRLATAFDEPALGGVYKLSAIRDPGATWIPKLKVSEQAIKTTTPGIPQVRRFRAATEFVGDAIYDLSRPVPEQFAIVDPLDPTRRKYFALDTPSDDLLVPICREGHIVYEPPPLTETRERSRKQLDCFHPGIKRFTNPHQYPVGLEQSLHDLKTRLVLETRGLPARSEL